MVKILIIVLLSMTPRNIHYADNFSQIFQYAQFSDSNKKFTDPLKSPFLRPFLPPTGKTWLELKSYPSSEHKILQDQIPKI